MSTKREQILTALQTKLQTMTAISSAKVFRSRVDPFVAANLPCVTIEPVNDHLDSSNFAFLDCKLMVRITTYASGEIPDQAADPIIADIHSKMMSDETLGGLLIGMAPQSLSYEFVEAGTPLVGISYEFELSYRTI